MAESKKQEASAQPLDVFYYPEANDGKGGTVHAKDKAEADAKAKSGDFINPSEAAPAAGEDEAK